MSGMVKARNDFCGLPLCNPSFSAPCQGLIDATVAQLHYQEFLLETSNISDLPENHVHLIIKLPFFNKNLQFIVIYCSQLVIISHDFFLRGSAMIFRLPF
jgi:hypothetical protein